MDAVVVSSEGQRWVETAMIDVRDEGEGIAGTARWSRG